jgi:hypothetical protein
MSAYSDDSRLEFLELRDELVTDLQADGLIFAESLVRLAFVTKTGGDDAAGVPAQEQTDWLVITPRPQVDMREQWRRRDGATVLVGDGKLVITRAVTETQLRTAANIEIDGVAYSLVAGELKRDPGGLDWIVIVTRV